MGIYDAYNAPNVASPHAARVTLPEYSKLATASYQIARGCIRFYVIAIGGCLLTFLLMPANPLITDALPRVLVAGVLTCLLAHVVGFGLGLIGMLQPAQRRSRAFWGVFLNGIFPCFFVALAVMSTLPFLGIR